jgi:hypothetical protein
LYDVTVGIPSGRRFALLLFFGMYTRLTGRATNGSVLRCILATKFALALEVSATSPSMPAVRRPALRSLTRRTLNSAFAREQSINFCRLRTLGRVPRPRGREDPLPKPPYALLAGTPINGVPVQDRVLWSVRHSNGRGVQLVLRFRGFGHLLFHRLT